MILELARKHFARGRTFELQSKLAEAEAAYRQALQVAPDLPEAHFALGRLAANRGDDQVALAHLDEAAGRAPTAEHLEWRAFVNGRLRRYEAALADYRAVVAMGEAHARVNLGRVLLALARYDEAQAVLEGARELPGVEVLLDALPRYREFPDPGGAEDGRAVRYLFGRTLLLGTMADGGLRLKGGVCWGMTGSHFEVTWRRFRSLVAAMGWRFDAVAGDGAHHGPLADWAAGSLWLPRATSATAAVAAGYERVLLVSAVVEGSAQSRALVAPWRGVGLRVLHLAFGFVPHGQPDLEEPEVVGYVGRCHVAWYRVAEHSRLVRDQESADPRWPGWRLDIPSVDPNRARVLARIQDEARFAPADRNAKRIVDYYRLHHRRVRAFEWEGTISVDEERET